jgi:catechol-2,3-dioxygenase
MLRFWEEAMAEIEVLRPVLHHVSLKTTRLQDMIRWYGVVTGLLPVVEFPAGAWLSNDAASHRLALLALPSLSDDPDKLSHTGMHHIAFEYQTLKALLDTYVRLKSVGILPHMALNHGMTMSFYYVDPDGNSVELQRDNFGDWQQSKAWMSTSAEFAINPIGTPVDVDLLIQALNQDAAPEDIHRRAYAGEFPSDAPMDPRLPL